MQKYDAIITLPQLPRKQDRELRNIAKHSLSAGLWQMTIGFLTWIVTCRGMRLRHDLTSYTKINQCPS